MTKPSVTGEVQKVSIYVSGQHLACIWVGPTPSNVEGCPVINIKDGKVDIVAAALTALANGLPITVDFDNQGFISNLTIPA